MRTDWTYEREGTRDRAKEIHDLYEWRLKNQQEELGMVFVPRYCPLSIVAESNRQVLEELTVMFERVTEWWLRTLDQAGVVVVLERRRLDGHYALDEVGDSFAEWHGPAFDESLDTEEDDPDGHGQKVAETS